MPIRFIELCVLCSCNTSQWNTVQLVSDYLHDKLLPCFVFQVPQKINVSHLNMSVSFLNEKANLIVSNSILHIAMCKVEHGIIAGFWSHMTDINDHWIFISNSQIDSWWYENNVAMHGIHFKMSLPWFSKLWKFEALCMLSGPEGYKRCHMFRMNRNQQFLLMGLGDPREEWGGGGQITGRKWNRPLPNSNTSLWGSSSTFFKQVLLKHWLFAQCTVINSP